MPKKHIADFIIREKHSLNSDYALLKLSPADGGKLPEMLPGQFVQIAVPGSKNTFLRRPISINYADYDSNLLWLLVRNAGEGTAHLISMHEGETLNLVLPLGNGFSIPDDANRSVLLVGGGVGVAPMLMLGKVMVERGFDVKFLLGARSQKDLLELDEFKKVGTVFVTTDDGSAGEHGVVTCHSILKSHLDNVYCCGPAPMMKAVARLSKEIGADCEVSLENMMACGIGACLCCVENTVRGNVCVCTEGPVFNINQLTW